MAAGVLPDPNPRRPPRSPLRGGGRGCRRGFTAPRPDPDSCPGVVSSQARRSQGRCNRSASGRGVEGRSLGWEGTAVKSGHSGRVRRGRWRPGRAGGSSRLAAPLITPRGPRARSRPRPCPRGEAQSPSELQGRPREPGSGLPPSQGLSRAPPPGRSLRPPEPTCAACSRPPARPGLPCSPLPGPTACPGPGASGFGGPRGQRV